MNTKQIQRMVLKMIEPIDYRSVADRIFVYGMQNGKCARCGSALGEKENWVYSRLMCDQCDAQTRRVSEILLRAMFCKEPTS